MSRYNTNVRSARRAPNTLNNEGAEAWAQDPKTELAALVTTNMAQDQYYRSAEDSLDRLRELVGQVDPLFAAKAAVYARNEDGIRSVTHAVAGELAHQVKGEQWTQRFYDRVVRRPDDVTEILAYYMGNYGKAPNALKKGLGRSLTRFDAYQLAKYRAGNKEISLVDAVNICHPKSTEALSALMQGTLKPAETWETKLSAAGKAEDKEAAKAEAWQELLVNRKIGYFALLRNLRNIATQAPELVDVACKLLVDEKLIRGSLVLPFRFLTAAQELRGNPKILAAISQAVDISLANVPSFENALIAVDRSHSMTSKVSGGDLDCHTLASLFAAVLFKKNHADVLTFADRASMTTGLNPTDSTFTIAAQIRALGPEYGTNFPAIFDTAPKAYESIIIISDSESWMTDWGAGAHGGYYVTNPLEALRRYKKRVDANPHIFVLDLTGYGTTQFPANQLYQISGFSDKTIKTMADLKQDRNALVHKIEAIEL